jgi:DNA-3-methyladenine glycosylase I
MPSRDERHLFEMLTLEGAQAGLSWMTILRKREGYRRAFGGFDPEVVAQYDEADVQRLLADASIVRNRGKIASTIANAQAVVDLRDQPGGFAGLIWSFVGDAPLVNSWQQLSDLPSETEASRAMSRELKKRGFRFVGSTTCYSLMQACGLVNDHVVGCYRYAEVQRNT